MKKPLMNALLSLLAMLTANAGYTYELATHGALAWHAYHESMLGSNSEIWNELGIEVASDNPFGEVYLDIHGAQVQGRSVYDFEKKVIEIDLLSLGEGHLSIPGWLMRGAIREDDAYKEANPQDDLYHANAELRRPLHHFYDPINDCGLFVGSCSQNLIETGLFGLGALDPDIHKAPDWAIGASDAFADVNSPEVGRATTSRCSTPARRCTGP